MKSVQRIADDFLQNASSQLAEGSRWLHEHHDGMLDKSPESLTETDIVDIMHAACVSSDYDANKYMLVTSIPLIDSDGIKLLHPTDLAKAIAENIKQNYEPPSLNLHHRSDLLSSLLGQTQFRVRYTHDQIPDHLRKCNVAIWYSTWPFDNNLINPEETEWSRSITMMHIPEIDN